jgi:altronate hydrolase
MLTMGSFIKIHPADTVAVALKDITAGEKIHLNEKETLAVLEDIPFGHKAALADIRPGEDVIKYGYSIGRAVCPIEKGNWVHSHNLNTNISEHQEYEYRPLAGAGNLCEESLVPSMAADVRATSAKPAISSGTATEPCHFFNGYLRENGDAGIRNEIWIIPTVGCVNKSGEKLARMANDRFRPMAVDGIFCYTHPYGCSQLGDDHLYTQRILAGLVRHPNAGGVLVLGLGCENNNISAFREVLGDVDTRRVMFLNTQDVENETEAGLNAIEQLISYASEYKRRPIPVSKLKVGLKCGGSDAFSGITANPLIGMFSDKLVSEGGTSILTEVPEMFGAETILMNRCVDEGIFHKTTALINDFKGYFLRYGQVVYENPSPGNKKGGITTLEEKSLGCIQKGGNALVSDVIGYGSQATVPGLNLLNGPGNDIVSVTALAAAGAHLILFSTGRGTPLGGPVPTVKISSNSQLAARKTGWIDFNAGVLLKGRDIMEVRDSLYQLVIETASGRKTCNEIGDYREIAIFKDGVTL